MGGAALQPCVGSCVRPGSSWFSKMVRAFLSAWPLATVWRSGAAKTTGLSWPAPQAAARAGPPHSARPAGRSLLSPAGASSPGGTRWHTLNRRSEGRARRRANRAPDQAALFTPVGARRGARAAARTAPLTEPPPLKRPKGQRPGRRPVGQKGGTKRPSP